MTISFEIPEHVQQQADMAKMAAEFFMRPVSRELDENEHQRPDMFVQNIWPVMRDMQKKTLDKLAAPPTEGEKKPERQSTQNLRLMLMIEMLSWGDAGIYLCLPGGALGGAAIEAVGTPEQKIRFLQRFAEGEIPAWGAMAMTEPGAGSDTSAIQTTAVLDKEANQWVLNGEKIFCTNGKLALDESNGLVVVWASIDRSAGRAGMRPFVVEAGTPGVKVTKTEIKHGIRASDTASIVLDNARIPADNILGSPEVQREGGGGFKGAMATFDATRPLVSASALGIGRASLEFVKEKLAEEGVEIPYNLPYHKLTAIQRDVLEMEAQFKAAYLLTLRAITLLDQRQPNNLESAMCKAKAGKVVTQISQKAVELLGPMGYSREWLAEKWMRDAKINDIFEGTGQINTLIVARRILGYSSKELG
ncbi:MAG: putative acyl-CoA dehydrogenase [Chloroflexi bacterium OLB15]|nr:MAG: putative acyl-CoA dehydrogenase [Chloroflexi bacterium OLB15]